MIPEVSSTGKKTTLVEEVKYRNLFWLFTLVQLNYLRILLLRTDDGCARLNYSVDQTMYDRVLNKT